jgi:hypothetical protein
MIELKFLSFKRLTSLLLSVIFEWLKRVKRITLSFRFYKRKLNSDEYKILDESAVFVLDLRGAHIDLHRLSVLVQFFYYLGGKYKVFQVWTNGETFSSVVFRLYPKESKDIISLITSSTKAQFLEKSIEDKVESSYSYLKISSESKAFTSTDTFQVIMNFESLPIRYSYPLDYERHPELESLKNNLNNTFNIVFSPTLDLNLNVESPDRKYGVISHDNFLKLEKLYLEIQERILLEDIHNIKIIFLNKKMFNWQYFPNIVDLRHFEDYGLNFASILYFIQECCEWSIGSEGTMQCYLMLSGGLKHVIYVDNSHWEYMASHGSTVPLFMAKVDYLNYKNAPNEYVPDKEEVINKIFEDYYKFRASID